MKWTSLAPLLFGAHFAFAAAAPLATLTVAHRSDVVSLDPYALEETLQLEIASNVYEPLVARDAQHRLEGALAVSWKQTDARHWRFQLRRGVRFHDGSPFSADDVVFSFERASSPGAGIPDIIGSIQAVKALDRYTVEIELKRPMPQFLDSLPYWLIMSRAWSAQHGTARLENAAAARQGYAASHANGTGPFVLQSRQPGVVTEYTRNRRYWRPLPGNLGQVRFLPIGDDQARVQALLRGEVDVIDPLPPEARASVGSHPGLALQEGPELRVIFLGMDQASERLRASDVKQGNPFADQRVRRAMALAIDQQALVREALQGAATPIQVLVPPQVKGYAKALDRPAAPDLAQARALLAEAGYGAGFSVTLDCPNNRYINDAKVCALVAQQLAQIGIQVALNAQDKGAFFAKLFAHQSDFYLLGAATGTGDAYSVLQPVAGSPDGKSGGSLNLGGYRNPLLDRLLAQADQEADPVRRASLMEAAQRVHQQEVGHLPLYQQWQSWGRKREVSLVQTPENGMPWRYIRVGVAASRQGGQP